MECKKIFLGGWFDFHRLDTETVDIISNFLNDKNNFFFGLTNKYYKKNSQIKNIPSFTTNINKIDLEIKFKKNFIPFQHFFSFEYNFKKDFLLNVPGAKGSYPLRKKIYDDLKKNKTIEIYNSNYLYNSIIDTHVIFRVIKKLVIKKNKVYRNTYNLVGNNFLTILQLINFLKKKSKSKSNIILSKYKKKNSSYICNKKISKTLAIKLASVKKIIYRNF